MGENFEEEVRAALDSVPQELARGLENVAVVVEDEHPGEPGLFGSFYGVPRTERSSFGPSAPATITIYRLPLEEAFSDPEELRNQIRITVLHELAHYFGIDEGRIGELGYE
jgi:predicted Zn-dependent protease with MMP-like domain